MMKIHTTQNLNVPKTNYPSTNSVSSNDFRLNQTSSAPALISNNISFGKAKIDPSKAKKFIEETAKKVGDIAKDAKSEGTFHEKLANSKFFNSLLSIADHEVTVQAAISCIICLLFRPLTIMALPNKKGKQDNMYAAAHSMSSGVIGLASTFLIANPFKNATSYAMKNLMKDFNIDTLKRMSPHLDIKSIADANGARKPVEEWLDIYGRKFIRDIKDVDKLPKAKNLADVSELTFKNILKADVDWAAQKGKSFNEIVTRDGKKLYDVIDMNNLAIFVKDEALGDFQVLLRDMDKDFLAKLIKDAQGTESRWAKLDINSVYKDGKIVDFRKWKTTEGNQFKLDLDKIKVSSVYETADYLPRRSGGTRFDAKEKVEKLVAYMKNGAEMESQDNASWLVRELGTPIDNAMVEANDRFTIHDKMLTWLPDIISRPFVATGTIALIPWMLKNVFHLEKSKKPAPVENTDVAANVEAENFERVEQGENQGDEVSFKGKGEKEASKFTKWLGKVYGKRLYESEKLSKFSEKLTKVPGSMTQHFQTLGALITSGVYVQQTLTKKDLDPDRKKTLAINQTLCWIVPTIMAYLVDNGLRNVTKKLEYGYAGSMENILAKAKSQGKDISEIQKNLGSKLKGVRILASLATFTLIYRYLAPVLITPLANKIGDTLLEKKQAKEQQKLQMAKA